jgi:hypothetical protein
VTKIFFNILKTNEKIGYATRKKTVNFTMLYGKIYEKLGEQIPDEANHLVDWESIASDLKNLSTQESIYLNQSIGLPPNIRIKHFMNTNSKIIYLSPQRSATKTFYTLCKRLNIRSLSWSEQFKESFDLLAINREYDKIINHSLFVENQSFSDTPFWDLKLAEYIKNNCENVFFCLLNSTI